MARGQIPQVFIFIMALLVIGATIFLGMRMAGSLTGSACKANDASFQRDLKQTIDDYATFGMRDRATISTPCDAVALCFIDTDALGNAAFSSNDTTINASVHANVLTNAFIKSRDNTLAAAYDARIKLDGANELCIPAIGGKFTFDTEGKGRTIVIRQIQ